MTHELYNQRILEYEQREEMIHNIRNGVKMNMQDLRVLKMKIESLTDEEQLKVYDIIVDNDQKEAMSIKYSSVLFDLEQLSSKTTWELDYFVKQCEWSKTQTTIDQDVKMEHVEHMKHLNNSLLEQSKKHNETEKDKECESIQVPVPTNDELKSNDDVEAPPPTEMTIDKLFELSKTDVKPRRTRKPRQPRKQQQTKSICLESEPEPNCEQLETKPLVSESKPKKRGRRKVRIISDVNQSN